MIATETIVPSKKLKIKLAGKRVEDYSSSRSREFGNLVGHKLSFSGNGGLKVDGAVNYSFNSFSDGKAFAAACCKSKSSIALKKRRETEVLESSREKKQKLDRSTTYQCSSILKTLMSHQSSWVFNQAVDPVALEIPDYFSIITDPMDLGTIKSKLEKNMYQGSEEFAADIRLTFSNAMLYNPPANFVHKNAKELNEIFEKRWELLKEKWICGRSNFQQAKLPSGQIGEKLSHIPSSHNISLHKRSMLSEGKVIKPSANANVAEVDRANSLQTRPFKPTKKNFHKGTETGSKHSSSSLDNQTPRQGASKCITCGNVICQCSSSSDQSHTSTDQSNERLLSRENPDSDDPCRPDCRARSLSASQTSKSDTGSDGVISTLEDESKSPCDLFFTHGAKAIPEEHSTPVFDVQLSPKKALRAAMLKSRFAETILKAQQKKLLDHVDKVDHVKMQQEKERLERRQREERARIEEQIRAADMASRMKAEAVKQQQREREREAARIAIHKVERTVEFDHNLEILNELEKLSGGVLFVQHYRCNCSAMVKRSLDDARLLTPLERLGLFMKEEFLEDEDDETIHGEDVEGQQTFSRI